MPFLCNRVCENKTAYGYCQTSYCIYPYFPNTAFGHFTPPQFKNTNADKIRCMTDEELAEWFLKIASCPCDAMNGGCALNDDTCRQAWLEWLKEEVKDG